MCAFLYENQTPAISPHLHPRTRAAGELYQIGRDSHRGFSFGLIIEAWGQLKRKRGGDLKGRFAQVCDFVGVDKPTQGQVKLTPMSFGPDGPAIFKYAGTFGLDSPAGFSKRLSLGKRNGNMKGLDGLLRIRPLRSVNGRENGRRRGIQGQPISIHPYGAIDVYTRTS